MPSERTKTDGDRGFIGIDQRREPSTLEPRIGADAVNKIFTREQAETRKGIITPAFGFQRGFDFPFDFDLFFDGIQGFGNTFGSTIFSDPNSIESIVITQELYAERFTEAGAKLIIRYPLDESVDEDVLLLQAYDVLLMFKGEALATWFWETLSI